MTLLEFVQRLLNSQVRRVMTECSVWELWPVVRPGVAGGKCVMPGVMTVQITGIRCVFSTHTHTHNDVVTLMFER